MAERITPLSYKRLSSHSGGAETVLYYGSDPLIDFDMEHLLPRSIVPGANSARTCKILFGAGCELQSRAAETPLESMNVLYLGGSGYRGVMHLMRGVEYAAAKDKQKCKIQVLHLSPHGFDAGVHLALHLLEQPLGLLYFQGERDSMPPALKHCGQVRGWLTDMLPFVVMDVTGQRGSADVAAWLNFWAPYLHGGRVLINASDAVDPANFKASVDRISLGYSTFKIDTI